MISKLPASLYWRTIRKVMPNRPSRWAGVKSHLDGKCLDACLLPDRFVYPRDRPNYENALAFGLRQGVRPGDRVTVIGGGFGITAVLASNLAGPGGSIRVFEGSSGQLEICQKVLARNETPAPVNLDHAIVGESLAVYGGHDVRARNVMGEDLEECEVLQMDCEGAEIAILKSIKIRPRVILCETHGFLGASTEVVAGLLRDLGYSVDDLGLAEIDYGIACVENDIRVLLGNRER